MSYKELPLKIGRNFYSTIVGGFGPLLYQDAITGMTYAGVGINESKLKDKGIRPGNKCLVRPIDYLSRKVMPVYMDYAAVIIPLSRSNYPNEFRMSPNGEAILPVWFGKSGLETLNFESEKSDQIVLNFQAFETENLFHQLIEEIQIPGVNELS